jgi:Tol biopolymer transport system component
VTAWICFSRCRNRLLISLVGNGVIRLQHSGLFVRRLVGICAFCAAAFSAEPDIREIFERARMLAERNQNLPEAIRLYAQVVQLATGHRALGADAQYRQGVLLLRQGKKVEAERAFAAVVRDFGDQTAVVKLARARLPSGGPPEVRQRLVWAGEEIDTLGDPSPDGRLYSFTDWTTGDLAVHDLSTGQNRRLTRNNLPLKDAPSAIWSVFSRDSARIAYTWFLPSGTWEIRVVGTRSTEPPRVLYRAKPGETPRVTDWSPDGKSVLVDMSQQPLPSAVLVSVADGTSRVLPVQDCVCGRMQFSPDGSFIAYDVRAAGADHIDIFTISVSGDRIEPIVQRSANDSLLGWSPYGKQVIFASDRSGRTGIWSVGVTEGKASSPVENIRPNTDPGELFRITKDGSMYYYVSTEQTEVRVADVDLILDTVTTPLRPVSQRYVGKQRTPAWSPDGKFLAYVASANGNLVIRSPESGEEREVAPQLANTLRIQEWRSDGSILVYGATAGGRFGYYAVNMQTGAATFVAALLDKPAFSADGRKMYYGSGSLVNPAGIFMQDLDTGETRTLYRPPDPRHTKNPFTTLSPDGQSLAIWLQDDPKGSNSLAVLPVGGSQPRILLSQSGAGGPLNWTPDSQRILYKQTVANRTEIWIVPAQGGAPKPLGIVVTGNVGMVRLSPDGKRVAMVARLPKDEIWVLENFLKRN